MGTHPAQLRAFERELLTGGWHLVLERGEVQWVAGPGGDEAFVLCRSATRLAKERAMREPASRTLEADLTRLAQQVATGKLTEEARIQRRIGRLLERYPSVAALYEIAVTTSGTARQVVWRERADRRAWREAREGAYLLRTNLTEAGPAQLWA